MYNLLLATVEKGIYPTMCVALHRITCHMSAMTPCSFAEADKMQHIFLDVVSAKCGDMV